MRRYSIPCTRWADGTIAVWVFIAENSGARTLRPLLVRPSAADYDFWLWLASRPHARGAPPVGDEELRRLRAEFAQFADQEGSPAALREHVAALVPVDPEPPERKLARIEGRWRDLPFGDRVRWWLGVGIVHSLHAGLCAYEWIRSRVRRRRVA